jgi:hypothetical protein
VLEWSRRQLEELLTAVPPAEAGGLRITRLKSCSGEVRRQGGGGGRRGRRA